MDETKEKLRSLLDTAPDNTLIDELLTFLWKVKAKELVQTYNNHLKNINAPEKTGQQWAISRGGRAWSQAELESRKNMDPVGKFIDVVYGKLLSNDVDRINLLAMLLENVGIDKTIELGDPQLWFDAVFENTAIGRMVDLALTVTNSNVASALENVDIMNNNISKTIEELESIRSNSNSDKEK